MQGNLTLVIEADNADVIATLIDLKAEVEATKASKMKVTIVGATKALLVAKELAAADIGVLLTPPRSFPINWDNRRYLGGPPLTEQGPVAYLASHGVNVGIGPHGIDGSWTMNGWAVRNLRFDAGWVALESRRSVSKMDALEIASSNIKKLLGLPVSVGELVATSGGDLLSFESKVVGILSSRRGIVDLSEIE